MTQENYIIYDGECPFCTRYVRFLRLREAVGAVDLVDARSDDTRVAAALDAGYDLDEGMIVSLNGAVYHGADCIHRLALLSTSSGLFNRLNAFWFRSPTVSRVLYPLLRACRNAVLRLLGRGKIAL